MYVAATSFLKCEYMKQWRVYLQIIAILKIKKSKSDSHMSAQLKKTQTWFIKMQTFWNILGGKTTLAWYSLECIKNYMF